MLDLDLSVVVGFFLPWSKYRLGWVFRSRPISSNKGNMRKLQAASV
jgi:hypothetical protein